MTTCFVQPGNSAPQLFSNAMKLIVSVFLLFSLACTAQKNTKGLKVTVEYNIYSGRVNPQWDLSAAECKELMKRLEALPDSDKAIEAGGLGYGGFSITIMSDTINKSSWRVWVFKKIILMDKGTQKNYQDIHGLEDWLLAQAADKAYRKL
jgi:hypothetical protein